MIFDDHEMIDDWNTSAAWRREVTAKDWWTAPDQRRAGQLLGLPAPGQPQPAGAGARTRPGRRSRRCRSDTDDAEPMLREMAELADAEPASIRWSFVRHWGDARLIMIDSRAGRVLEEQRPPDAGRRRVRLGRGGDAPGGRRGRRAPDPRHVAAVAAAARHPQPRAVERDAQRAARGPVAGTAGREGAAGRRPGALGGVRALLRAARPGADRPSPAASTGRAPATALVLSGDVHHAYAAELVQPAAASTRGCTS